MHSPRYGVQNSYLNLENNLHDFSHNRNKSFNKSKIMPKDMFSGSYTIEGVAGGLSEGVSARRDEAARIAEMLVGTLEAYYWCYGDTDFMCIMDVPDSAKIAKLALHIGASGTFSGNLTPLITVEEMDDICNADIGDFRLPGQ